MTLMLAAEAKGLASGPMIGFDVEGLRREFLIPERYVPVMLLPVGDAAEGNWSRKPRLTLHKVLISGTGEGLPIRFGMWRLQSLTTNSEKHYFEMAFRDRFAGVETLRPGDAEFLLFRRK